MYAVVDVFALSWVRALVKHYNIVIPLLLSHIFLRIYFHVVVFSCKGKCSTVENVRHLHTTFKRRFVCFSE
jgi:hypothetical protein